MFTSLQGPFFKWLKPNTDFRKIKENAFPKIFFATVCNSYKVSSQHLSKKLQVHKQPPEKDPSALGVMTPSTGIQIRYCSFQGYQSREQLQKQLRQQQEHFHTVQEQEYCTFPIDILSVYVGSFSAAVREVTVNRAVNLIHLIRREDPYGSTLAGVQYIKGARCAWHCDAVPGSHCRARGVTEMRDSPKLQDLKPKSKLHPISWLS